VSAAELVGDLAVLYVELAAIPRPYVERGGRRKAAMRFDAWLRFGTHLFRLAIDAGIAVAAVPPPREALAALADAVQSDERRLLYELHAELEDVFDYMGHEYGGVYGGQPWDKLCRFRSGLGFLAELAGGALDFSEVIDRNLEVYGPDLYEPLDPPSGMPRSHWWWFDSAPPA
jgi:hypothetical protein